MGAVQSISEAHALREARKILQASFLPGATVWKRRIRHSWQTSLKRDVLVELTREMLLRVTDAKTGELLAQGPAAGGVDRFNTHC
ncbi:MAG: hypothetical protein KAY82_02085 [Hylemonella sp.]|nr:hypothetical protein [Hylemonella sp.]